MGTVGLYAAALVVFIHGLIHLLGFVAYWQLAEIENLPYKTTLLGGLWDVGEAGIRVFGALWLVAAIGFVVAAYGLAAQQDWWRTAMIVMALFSLVLTVLDWKVAFAGIAVNVVILAVVLLLPCLFA